MDWKRSERKPAELDLPASVRKLRGMDGESPHVKTISFDEMRTCVEVRRGEKRQSVWIWPAAMEEWDGSRWSDFKVGGLDSAMFHRLLRAPPRLRASAS